MDEAGNQTLLSKSCYFLPAVRLLFHIFWKTSAVALQTEGSAGAESPSPKNNNFLNTGYSLAGTSEHRGRAWVFSFSPVSSALLCNYWRHCWQHSRLCGRRGQTGGTVFPWYPFTHAHAARRTDRLTAWHAKDSGGSNWKMFMHREQNDRTLQGWIQDVKTDKEGLVTSHAK